MATQMAINPLVADPEKITLWLADRPTATTRHSYCRSLVAFYKWMVLTDRRVDDPMIKVPRPKTPKGEPRPISAYQLEVVWNSRLRATTRTKILFAAGAGLRRHEIAKIHGQQFNFDEGTMRVTGKGGRVDIIPVHPVLLDHARLYPGNSYWFPSGSGHVTDESVGTVISRAFRKNGFDVTAHQLRHYFATSMLAADVDIRIVQTLMRHENLSTTARYVRVTLSQQRDAISRFPVHILDPALF